MGPGQRRGAAHLARLAGAEITELSRSEVFDCEATPALLEERAGRAGRVWLALDEGTLKYDLRRQAGAGTWQLFCFDPNCAKVELDFDASEMM